MRLASCHAELVAQRATKAPNAETGAAVRRVGEQSMPMLCTMLNNIYAAESKLRDLWGEIGRGWTRAVGSGSLQETALDKALGTLRKQVRPFSP